MGLCVRCYRLCNNYGISKFVYLACATLVTAGFIIECILIHLAVVPYTSESAFKEANCTYVSSKTAVYTRCENKCSKERSKFPCLPIKVNYTILSTKKNATGWIYDYYRTYSLFKSSRCATSPCQTRQDDNLRWVQAFNRSLRRARFPCFYNTLDQNDVLLYKLHPFSLALHSILWPTLIFVLGILTIWLTYCIAGCSVWTQDKTVIA